MFQVYSVNEALGSWTRLRSFANFDDAEGYALRWFGNPARVRRFASMVVVEQSQGIRHGERTEVVRGEA